MFLRGSRIEQKERLCGTGRISGKEDFLMMRRDVSGSGLFVAMLE